MEPSDWLIMRSIFSGLLLFRNGLGFITKKEIKYREMKNENCKKRMLKGKLNSYRTQWYLCKYFWVKIIKYFCVVSIKCIPRKKCGIMLAFLVFFRCKCISHVIHQTFLNIRLICSVFTEIYRTEVFWYTRAHKVGKLRLDRRLFLYGNFLWKLLMKNLFKSSTSERECVCICFALGVYTGGDLRNSMAGKNQRGGLLQRRI